MKFLRYTLIISFILSLILLLPDTSVYAQDAGEELTESVEEVTEDTLSEDESNMWNLVAQAGPIRYPIFAILFIGIFLICLKGLELHLDSKRATSLRNTPFTDFSLEQISKTLSRQSEHMLSVVMSKLLNVFQTNKNADYLHDEIYNYAKYRQDHFNSFRNKVDFLSDTAGALGLLGTVWGMFMVFSSGTLERDAILAGMGLALMSTLLGLIVSIVLNFASTMTEGYFTKRLSRVTNKADELRFRLIELSENSVRVRPNNKNQDVESHHEEADSTVKLSNNNRSSATVKDNFLAEAFQKRLDRDSENEKSQKPADSEPERLVIKSELNNIYKAGSEIEEIEVQLMGTNKKPIPMQELDVFLKHSGSVNGESDKAKVTTNNKGIAVFSWQLSGETGKQAVGIRCSDRNHQNVRKEIALLVKPAEPHSIQIINNHQAAVTGSSIPKPVAIVIKDEFGNPVPSISVVLEVSMGNGTFPDGKQKSEIKTNDTGKIQFEFKLGDEPGFNAVDIRVSDYNLNQKFQAVGQEVTV